MISKIAKTISQYPSFRQKQAINAVFQELINSWDEATSLPKDLRVKLKDECPLSIEARVSLSFDKKTAKASITLIDGLMIETVLIRQADRQTVCVSSQVGCSLNCRFCATGSFGFERNLTADEIVEQVIFWSRYLKRFKKRVTNVVFMGMGEPFLNYDQIIKAIKVINELDKFNIGARHISISTAGVVEGIKKLSQEPLQVNLAVSLSASNNKLRNQIIPLNKKYPIEEVLKATRDYINQTNRRVMIEYVMLKDINDSRKCAEELVKLLQSRLGRLFMVNLISCNQIDKYQPSSRKTIDTFKKILEENKIEVTERYRFGREIKGACGQLIAEKLVKIIRRN